MAECSCKPTGSYCLGASEFHVGQEVTYADRKFRVRGVLFAGTFMYSLDILGSAHTISFFEDKTGMKPTGLWYHVDDLVER